MVSNRFKETLCIQGSLSLLKFFDVTRGQNRLVHSLLQKWLRSVLAEKGSPPVDDIERLRSDLIGNRETPVLSMLTDPEKQWVREAAHWGRSRQWLQLMGRLLETFQIERCLEVGTCLGFSAAHLDRTLQSLHPVGTGSPQVHTFELNETLIRSARENLKFLGARYTEVHPYTNLGEFRKFVDRMEPPDLVFLDGEHSGPHTLSLTEIILDRSPAPMIVVVDDIRWSPDMNKAWSQMVQNPKVSCHLDLHFLGVCFVNYSSLSRAGYYLPCFLH